MSASTELSETDRIQSRLLQIVAGTVCCHPQDLSFHHRFVEDLGCDSLDLVDLVMNIEREFQVTVDAEKEEWVKQFFTRDFRVSDLLEAVLSQKFLPLPDWMSVAVVIQEQTGFSAPSSTQPVHRAKDGMLGIYVPESAMEIQTNHGARKCRLCPFVIDSQLVSTTQYCQFLNEVNPSTDLASQWMLLDRRDDRFSYLQIESTRKGWRPTSGREKQPMVLVTWYGANAYSRWANDEYWCDCEDGLSYLPTESQWQLLANSISVTGIAPQKHQFGTRYSYGFLPLANVDENFSSTSSGVLQLTGHVWQWCQDWYHDEFYEQIGSELFDPVQSANTGRKSERGGSWVGPEWLSRPTYRRGRRPFAMGRCLGFRCVFKS
jgi:formylglycine-generating enzyme